MLLTLYLMHSEPSLGAAPTPTGCYHLLSCCVSLALLCCFVCVWGAREMYRMEPVASVAYQVIPEPGIGQFRKFESHRVHPLINS